MDGLRTTIGPASLGFQDRCTNGPPEVSRDHQHFHSLTAIQKACVTTIAVSALYGIVVSTTSLVAPRVHVNKPPKVRRSSRTARLQICGVFSECRDILSAAWNARTISTEYIRSAAEWVYRRIRYPLTAAEAPLAVGCAPTDAINYYNVIYVILILHSYSTMTVKETK